MPTSIPTANPYYRASDIPERVWAALESNPENANVILPQLKKTHAAEQSGKINPDNVWITYNVDNTVEFILSCTEGYMGAYPVFIFTTLSFDEIHEEYLRPCMKLLAEALKGALKTIRRVYSVFAPEPITRVFADEWSKLTGIRNYADEPYYAAKISFCTKRSFVNRQTSVHPSLTYDLRPAVISDIPNIAKLCLGFTDFPFYLDITRATEEATYLVHNNLVWVHTVRRPGQTELEIASIVAFTRNSDTVATISKVYTNPNWRRYGCAERLVRRVCKHLLLTKQSVALYVAHDNLAAAKVYHRVGFQGLSTNAPPVAGVDPWLEIGFDRSEVHLGHW